MQCSRSYCQAEFRSALLPSICQLAADDNAFPWFVPSLTLFRWLYTTRTVSVRLFLSRPSAPSSAPSRPSPPPPPCPHLPLHLHGHPFSPAPLFPFLYRIYSSLSAYGHVRTMQRSNGFVIELPSTANFILFWESADTHARTHARSLARSLGDVQKDPRTYVVTSLLMAEETSVSALNVYRRA